MPKNIFFKYQKEPKSAKSAKKGAKSTTIKKKHITKISIVSVLLTAPVEIFSADMENVCVKFQTWGKFFALNIHFFVVNALFATISSLF